MRIFPNNHEFVVECTSCSDYSSLAVCTRCIIDMNYRFNLLGIQVSRSSRYYQVTLEAPL